MGRAKPKSTPRKTAAARNLTPRAARAVKGGQTLGPENTQKKNVTTMNDSAR